jgi:hypothetical protein
MTPSRSAPRSPWSRSWRCSGSCPCVDPACSGTESVPCTVLHQAVNVVIGCTAIAVAATVSSSTLEPPPAICRSIRLPSTCATGIAETSPRGSALTSAGTADTTAIQRVRGPNREEAGSIYAPGRSEARSSIIVLRSASITVIALSIGSRVSADRIQKIRHAARLDWPGATAGQAGGDPR